MEQATYSLEKFLEKSYNVLDQTNPGDGISYGRKPMPLSIAAQSAR